MTTPSLNLAGRGFSCVEDHTTRIARPPMDNRGRRQAFRQVSLAGVPTRRLLDDDESSAGVSESGRRRWHPSLVAHPLRKSSCLETGIRGRGDFVDNVPAGFYKVSANRAVSVGVDGARYAKFDASALDVVTFDPGARDRTPAKRR